MWVTNGNKAGGFGDHDSFHLVLGEVEEPPQEPNVATEKVNLMEEAGVVKLLKIIVFY
jgi:hypothetical protein